MRRLRFRRERTEIISIKYFSEHEFTVEVWTFVKKLADGLDGEVGEGGSILLRQGVNELECFFDPNG
jgi:hypothetical protein